MTHAEKPAGSPDRGTGPSAGRRGPMKPAVVVGTVFVDLKGFSHRPIDCQGRNPGTVEVVHGGVGRNVAETMALLGTPVRFVSSVTAGGVGEEVLSRLARVGIETGGVAQAETGGHGTYLAILEPDGRLACSISHVPDFSAMAALWEEQGEALLQGAGQVVLELDLEAGLVARILEKAVQVQVPVVALPGNFSVVRARPDLLRQVDAFILNRHEAEILLGRPVPSEFEAAAEAARELRKMGPQTVIITLAEQGAVGAGPKEEWAAVPALPVTEVDVTGAGDAFVAGYSYAQAAGATLVEGLTCAVRVAAWTVNSPESVCTDLPERVAQDDWPGWELLR